MEIHSRCPRCEKEIASAVNFCPYCGFDLNQPQERSKPSQSEPKKTAIFQIIAIIAFIVGLFTPRIFLSFPSLIVLVAGAISLIRKEPRWGLSLTTIFLGLFLLLSPGLITVSNPPSSTSKRSTVQPPRRATGISNFEILDWNWTGPKHGYYEINGEIRNNGKEPMGVELQLICRDANKRVVYSIEFWPASIKNIQPGSTWPIHYMVEENPRIKTMSLKVIDVKKW